MSLEYEYHCFSINMSVERGQLIAVVGHVGCGKSSLVSLLLGEMAVIRGSVKLNVRLLRPRLLHISFYHYISVIGILGFHSLCSPTSLDTERNAPR